MDKTRMAIDVFDKCAKEYQDKFMEFDLYHQSFDVFCNHVTKQRASILEIACGPGNITRYLLLKRPDFKIMGIDLSKNMIELAKVNNPKAEFELMDCRNIGAIDKKFEAIMCGFCLPYLSAEEAVKLIRDAAGLLYSGGIFYLSTMEDDYSKSGITKSASGYQMYIHYHEADYLASALKDSGFEFIHFEHKDFPLADGTKSTDLLIIARKQ